MSYEIMKNNSNCVGGRDCSDTVIVESNSTETGLEKKEEKVLIMIEKRNDSWY